MDIDGIVHECIVVALTQGYQFFVLIAGKESYVSTHPITLEKNGVAKWTRKESILTK
jgi:hypothetical protein